MEIMFYILYVLIAIAVLMLVFVIMQGVDNLFSRRTTGFGTIIACHFEKSHYTTVLVYNCATKTWLPQTTYHPDAWKVVINIKGRHCDFYLDEQSYLDYKVKNVVKVEYCVGPIFGDFYLQTIQKV